MSNNLPLRRAHAAGRPSLVRSEGDGGRTITGYGAIFYRAGDPGTEYRIADDLVERIMPGAFDDALADDVRCLWNHNASAVLGRTKSGTLRISADDTGLKYVADLPNTQAANDLLVSIERGDVDASSFGFWPTVTTYREEPMPGHETRKQFVILREKVRLLDVSPVTFPAYEGTSVGLRDDSARAEVEAWRAEVEASKPIPRSVVEATARLVEIS